MQLKSLTKTVDLLRVLTLQGIQMQFQRSQLVQDGGVKFARDSRISLDMSLGGFESDTQLFALLLTPARRGSKIIIRTPRTLSLRIRELQKNKS